MREARPDKSPWNTVRDRLIALALALVCVVAGIVVWLNSDHRATIAESATPSVAAPPIGAPLPAALRELWQAPSPATPTPVAEGGTVVTGAGGEVLGRDPVSGEPRWRYSRDIPLCTVAAAWSKVVAVHRKEGLVGDPRCSDVTQFEPGTGERTAQRNADSEVDTRLINDGTHLTSTGTKLLNTWRNDLVKSMEFGQVSALTNPNKQPRTGCNYGSVATANDKIGVIERCSGNAETRITVYRTTAEQNKDSDEPSEVFSTILADKGAQLVAMSGNSTAVLLPAQQTLMVFDSEGKQKGSYPVPVTQQANQDPAGRIIPTSVAGNNVLWHNGSDIIALSKENLSPQWTFKGGIGTGITFGGQLVLPTPEGLAVVNPANGSVSRTIPVNRHGHTGPVTLGTSGPILLEQRGDTLVALGA